MKKCIVVAAIIGTGAVCYAAGVVDGILKSARVIRRAFKI